MSEGIRAFVGHSFTKDDEILVLRFTKYLDQLKNSLPNFSWTHAEKAEPKQLADKVLSLMAEANVFIGICTSKEAAVSANELRPSFIKREYYHAKKSSFELKTSDWIIQEIGLAIGMGRKLVLFVEEGVRKPGGLQGNIEYISFSRTNPDPSFVKLLEMMSALSPKAALNSSDATSKSAPPTAQDDTKSKSRTPQPDWTEDDYERAYFFSMADGDDAEAEKISSAYLISEHAQKDLKSIEWKARCIFLRLAIDKGGDLNELANLAIKYDKSRRVIQSYADALERFEQFEEAAKHFNLAAAIEEDTAVKARLLRETATNFKKANVVAKAAEATTELAALAAKEPSTEAELLLAKRQIAESDNNEDFAVAALERAVEIRPDNFAARFDLAYKHSEIGNKEMAFHHYLKIPDGKRHNNAWNNLGVSYSELDMPIKSVAAYRRSEAMEETLAMSNLGYKLLDAGFLDEAKQICDKAMQKKPHHKNVNHLNARLSDDAEEELKKEKEVLEKARGKIEFFRDFGRGIAAILASPLPEKWIGPNGQLTLKLESSELKISGTYIVDPSRLLSAMTGGDAKAKPETYSINYEGKLEGLCC